MSSSPWAAVTRAPITRASVTRTGFSTTLRAKTSSTCGPIRDEIRSRVEQLISELQPIGARP